MNDNASERDDAAPAADVADAQTSPRRVLNPDLLWVESVTERLLGSSEPPPTWERAPIGEQVARGAHPAADESATTAAELASGTYEPAPEPDRPDAEVHPLPVRTPRPVTRPLSYAEVLADRPRIRLTEEPPPVPYFASTTDETDQEVAEAAAPTSSTAPRGRAARPSPGEDMPAGVLRAALRDALPDDTARRSSAVDAIFGDPSWRVAPEPEAADDGEVEDAASAPAAAPAAPETEPVVEAPEVEAAAAPQAEPAPAPEDVQRNEPLAPRPPVVTATPAPQAAAATPEVTPPAAAPVAPVVGRHRTPDAGDSGTDVTAIRMALRSGDEDLAAAVLALVADRGRERERVRMVEAYLDAVLAEGDEGLAGAARLRRLLGE